MWSVFSPQALPFLSEIRPRPFIHKLPNETCVDLVKRIDKVVTEMESAVEQVPKGYHDASSGVMQSEEDTLYTPGRPSPPTSMCSLADSRQVSPASTATSQQIHTDGNPVKVDIRSTWSSIQAPTEWPVPYVPVNLAKAPRIFACLETLSEACRTAQNTDSWLPYRELVVNGKFMIRKALCDAATPFCKYPLAVKWIATLHATRPIAAYFALHYRTKPPITFSAGTSWRVLQRAHADAFYAHVAAYQAQRTGDFDTWLKDFTSLEVFIGLKDLAEKQDRRDIWQEQGTLLPADRDSVKIIPRTKTIEASGDGSGSPDLGAVSSAVSGPVAEPLHPMARTRTDRKSHEVECKPGDEGLAYTEAQSFSSDTVPSTAIAEVTTAPQAGPFVVATIDEKALSYSSADQQSMAVDSPGSGEEVDFRVTAEGLFSEVTSVTPSTKMSGFSEVQSEASTITAQEERFSVLAFTDPTGEQGPANIHEPLDIPKTAKKSIRSKLPKELFM
ncbi:hypothetical protein IAT40_007745 [Kwoniella sp. CBS 6097]